MATKAERVEAIKAQLVDPRVTRDAQDLAKEMERLHKHGCELPDGTANEWHEAIWEAVGDGYLELIRGTDVKRVAPRPPTVKQDAQGLFNFDGE